MSLLRFIHRRQWDTERAAELESHLQIETDRLRTLVGDLQNPTEAKIAGEKSTWNSLTGSCSMLQKPPIRSIYEGEFGELEVVDFRSAGSPTFMR